MNRNLIKNYLFGIIVLLVFDKYLNNVSAISVEKFLSLTLQEKTALDQFRLKVKPILSDGCMSQDINLIRWLRARNFDVNAAERMLHENLKWRKQNNIGNIKNEDFRDMEQDYPLTIDTYDKIGQPIGVVDLYEWDVRRAVLQGNGQRLHRYSIGLIENITGQVCEKQLKGMNVTQVVVLLNADGINVVQQACPICLPLWIQFVTVVENYYPEWLDEFLIIDSSPPVHIIVNTLRPIFSRSTSNAIKIFGHNKSKWMSYLDNKINRTERRKVYGGTKPPYKYKIL